VERARLHPADVERGEPAPQLARRPRSERHRQDLLRDVDAGVYAVRDAMGDRAGLARAGTGEDADGAGHGHRGGPLFLVERGEDGLGAGHRAGVRTAQ
jgi:hypothetical protein